MLCAHCCYSCTMKGRHMPWNTFIDAVSFIRNWDDTLSIGGGEPTLHPRFFDILKICLDNFNYVWMATNGSKTDIMYRLSNIIDGEDYQNCECSEEDIASGYCQCYEKCYENSIYQDGKLSVALSQDCFHDEIDERIVNMWTMRANNHGPSHFEIRDVTKAHSGIIAQGRAKKTGSGWNEEDCVCSDVIIKPSGKLKLCGCNNAPYIGNIWSGIDAKWEEVLNDDCFMDAGCYNYWKKHSHED